MVGRRFEKTNSWKGVISSCHLSRLSAWTIKLSSGHHNSAECTYHKLYTHTVRLEREIEMFYLTTHSTHFIYSYMAPDIWLRTILIVRKETWCRHIGYSYWLKARVLLYAPSHRQDNTYHSLCYTSRGALAGTRNSSMGPPHEGSIRRPIAPWSNALPLSYIPLPSVSLESCHSFRF